MIVDIHQMINIIEDFMCNDWIKEIDIGGCVGSNIFRICMETVTGFCNFNDIMIIEGCQDFIEMQSEFLPNHIFYAEGVATGWCNDLRENERDLPKFMRSDPSIVTYPRNMNEYRLIVFNDSHLIPDKYKNIIRNSFAGKIINVVDPYDYGCERFTHAPTVVDTINKVSTIQAYARRMFNIETRAIDKNVICRVREIGKIPVRSVGKQDKNQYVTPYKPIIDYVKSRRNDGLRKGQRVICRSNFINTYGSEIGTHIFTNHSIGTLQTNRQLINGLYKVRLHNSRYHINCDLSMNPDAASYYETIVEPASILSIDDMHHHKFNSIVLVLPEDGRTDYTGITNRELYSVLRNTNDLSIGYMRI